MELPPNHPFAVAEQVGNLIAFLPPLWLAGSGSAGAVLTFFAVYAWVLFDPVVGSVLRGSRPSYRDIKLGLHLPQWCASGGPALPEVLRPLWFGL